MADDKNYYDDDSETNAEGTGAKEGDVDARALMTAPVRRMLYDKAKRINLVDFISRNAGTTFERSGSSNKAICPMPSHRDSKPSFHVADKGGIWVYTCFGCGSSGTIIDFCKDYYSLDDSLEALILIMEKEGVKSLSEAMIKAVRDVKIGVDVNKALECTHFVAASNCRRLLRKFPGDKSIETWVAKAYMKMNDLMDGADRNGVNRIGKEAMAKIVEVK